MKKKLGNQQKKLVTYLLGGATLLVNRAPSKQMRIVRDVSDDLRELNKPNSERALTSLEKNKFIHLVKRRGGFEPRLTKEGKRLAYLNALHDIHLKKPRKWDKKWRVVSFDIPEEQRYDRDAFRYHLKRLGFFEIHQSLFVAPYQCEDEIRYIAHQLNVNPYIHSLIADEIDHDKRLKTHFNL